MLPRWKSGDKASEAYELVGPIELGVPARRKLIGVLEVLRGLAPLAARSQVEYQVVDRTSGRVVYRATTRNAVSEQAWHETLAHDLHTLSKVDFDTEWGIKASLEGPGRT